MTAAASDYATARAVDFTEIPVVSLTGIETPQGRARAGAEMVRAAREVGFFYITDHDVPQARIDAAFDEVRAFFALAPEAKQSVAVNTSQRGWMAPGMAKLEGAKTFDAKEVFFWGWDVTADDSDVIAGVPMVAPNQWPDTVAPDFRTAICAYYDDVVRMGRAVMAALAVGLGKEATFFDAAYARPLARAQAVYYPKMADEDVAAQRFGAAAHSDFGALTILKQDDVGGLQVQNRAGDWIAAPPIDGSFVCNIGDLLELWTNGHLISTKHRVLNASGRNRYSIPVFFDPHSLTAIDPADFAAGERLNYEATTAGAHIAGRNSRNFEALHGTGNK